MTTHADGLLNLMKSLEPQPKGKVEEYIQKLSKEKKETTFVKLAELIVDQHPDKVNSQDHLGFTILHYACAMGYIKLVETLLIRNASDSLKTTTDGMTPLALAEQHNHQKIIYMLNQPRRLVVKQKSQAPGEEVSDVEMIKDWIEQGMTANLKRYLATLGGPLKFTEKEVTNLVQLTCFVGNLEGLKLLIKKGADVNVLNSDNTSCLHKAVLGNRVDVVKFLIAQGCTPNEKDSDGITPLHLACHNGNVEIVKSILEAHADVTCLDNEQMGPLHHGVLSGNLETVELLLKKGSRVNAANSRGLTPLHLAVTEKHPEVFKLLLKNGADYKSKDNEGLTALHQAAFVGSTEIMKSLLANSDLDVNEHDRTGATALHKACYSGFTDCVKLLLEKGAIVESQDGKTSPLHHAAFSGHIESLELLLAKKPNVNCRDSEKASPLHKASFSGHVAAVSLLLKNGASVGAPDNEGSTPLHKAAFSGRASVISELIKAGAEVDAQDIDEGTPLHNACFNGHLDCVKILLQHQANLNCADNKGASPLHLAVLNGHREVAAYLIEHGAQVDSPDDRGMTALHHAIAHSSCLELLIEKGAKIDHTDTSSRTALFYAAKNNCEEGCRFLISKGASLDIQDHNGMTPMEIARPGFQKIINEALKQRVSQTDTETQKKYAAAVKAFNTKPKKGIEFLIQNEIIQGRPDEIAKFLHSVDKLDKRLVGEFISEYEEYNQRILSEFVAYCDFSGLDFDDALRYFLSKFRLPGEAQKIDRIMERFAKRYVENNQKILEIFVNQDTAYILAFSLIMLNTDAHNPGVKTKMTKEQFVKNNRGICNGKDVPRDFMESMYDKITKNEIKMEKDGFGSAEKKGWVTKQGGRVKTWKKRWLVLKDNCLYYFKKPEDVNPLGIIPLENLLVRPVEVSKKRAVFEVYSPSGEDIKSCKFENNQLVQGHHGNYLIAAATKEEMDLWLDAIKTNIAFNPLLELIKKKISKFATRSTQVPHLTKPSESSANLTSTTNGNQNNSNSSTGTVPGTALVDFQEICGACLMCSAGYKEAKVVKELYGSTIPYGNDEASKTSFFCIIDTEKQTQTVVFSGPIPEFFLDTKKSYKPVDIYAKFAFSKIKEAAHNLFAPVLNKKIPVAVYGHGLGGCLAIIYSLHLQNEGYDVSKILTFGQPRMVRKKDLGLFSQLPLIRVVDFFDPLPVQFVGYIHFGPEIVLFEEAFYCLVDSRDISDNLNHKGAAVEYNSVDSYVKNLKAKLKNAISIPYEERRNKKMT